MHPMTPTESEASARDVLLAFLRAGSGPGLDALDASLEYLAEEFTGFGTGPSDHYPDTAAFAALVRREKELGPASSTFDVQWMDTRELSDGVALSEGQVRFQIEMAGATHIVEPRFTAVATLRAGRWLITHFHFSLANAAQGAEDTLLDSLLDRNRQLEREVARRTAELERALEDLHAAQARLIQQEKLAGLGRLTSGIAHEIKNPLNFVNNFAGLADELAAEADQALAGAARDPDEARALLADLRVATGRVVEHGRRADAIVRAMMQHARGGTELARPVDVNALAEEHVRLALEAAGGAGGVDVVRAYDPAAGLVEAAPQDLGRVLLNLLANALDAVAERADSAAGEAYLPTITVRTERTAAGVRIAVEDNGVGLPAGAEGRLFEPFYTTKPPGGGNVGLGLSLSRDVVVAHGGEIEAAPAEGQGAVFVITLPAASGA
jgi:signal transduction histidine kinase